MPRGFSPPNVIDLLTALQPSAFPQATKSVILQNRERFMTSKLFSELGLSEELLKAIDKLGFEQAAPMRVFPAPNIVTYVSMLFCGVPAADVEHWRVSEHTCDHHRSCG